MKNWKVAWFGLASKGKKGTRINSEIRTALSRKRITVSIRISNDVLCDIKKPKVLD